MPFNTPVQQYCGYTGRPNSVTYAHQAIVRGWIDDSSGDGSHVFVVVEWGRKGPGAPRVPSEKPVILCAAELLQARIATLMRLRRRQCILQFAHTH